MTYRRFVGTDGEYRALHSWVERNLGKPQECENCGTTDAPRFHWANISDKYLKDLCDWARLCAMCHRLIDSKPSRPWFGRGQRASNLFREFCIHGHRLVLTNLYISHNNYDGKINIQCMACRRNDRLKYLQRLATHTKETSKSKGDYL